MCISQLASNLIYDEEQPSVTFLCTMYSEVFPSKIDMTNLIFSFPPLSLTPSAIQGSLIIQGQ
jgi:hypothetical protein